MIKMDLGKMNFSAIIKKLDSEIYDGIISHMICTICQDIYKEPTTTPCGHTFCSACLRRVLSTKGNSGCPLCKNSVNRRDLHVDLAKLKICHILYELPTAFKSDEIDNSSSFPHKEIHEIGKDQNFHGHKVNVTELASEHKQPTDDFSNCKLIQFGSPERPKTRRSKPPKSGPVGGKQKKIEKEGSDVETFSPIMKRGSKVAKYKNKKNDELISVSRMETTSDSDDIPETSLEIELKKTSKISGTQKLNKWFEDAGDNLYADISNNSIFGEKSQKKEPSKSSMIRIDYKKKELLNKDAKSNKDRVDTEDPYEFIASQKQYPSKKKRSKRTPKKIPDFQALQCFSKETVRRLTLNDEREKTDSEKLDEILFGDSKISEADNKFTDDSLPATVCLRTDDDITASQKFEKLLSETAKEDQTKRHTRALYTPNSEQSLARSYESEPEPIKSKKSDKKKNDTKNNDTIDDSFFPKLYESPRKDNLDVDVDIDDDSSENNFNTFKKRKRNSRNSNSKRRKSIVSDESPDIEEVSEKPKQNTPKMALNVSDTSRSPGWSRVSILKTDFEGPKRQKRLNISGGGITMNTSKSSLLVKDTPDDLTDNNDMYIEDFSQNSEALVGFQTEEVQPKEENFINMVKEMEDELDQSDEDLTLVKENGEDDRRTITPVYDNQESVDFSELQGGGEMEVEETEEVKEPKVVEEVREKVVQEMQPVKEKEVVANKKKAISFTLLGKIKKKKNSSTLFLQLGRLTPLIRRSRSSVVKLVFPAAFPCKRKPQPTKFNVGIQTSQSPLKSQEIAKTVNTIRVQTSPKTQVTPTKILKATTDRSQQMTPKISKPKGIQTSQNVQNQSIQTSPNHQDAEVQTTPKIHHSEQIQTSQALSSANVQTSQIITSKKSAAVQTSLLEKFPVAVHTSESSKFNVPSCLFTKFSVESKSKPESIQWEEDEGLAKVTSQPVPKSHSYIDTQLQNEFKDSWDKNEDKDSSQSDEILNTTSRRRSMRICTNDLEDKPEEVIDLISQQKSLNSQEEKAKVNENINEDLARLKILNSDNEEDEDFLSASQKNSLKAHKSEESDSDMFVEQTPPKLNTTRHNVSLLLEKKPKENADTESMDIIAETIPKNKMETESFLEIDPKEHKIPTQIEKINKIDFPSREKFFEVKNQDENDQNTLNASAADDAKKKMAAAKTAQVKSVVEFWNRSDEVISKKKRICVVASSVKNPENIEKFVSKFKVEYLNKPSKEMTHLIVGLHENDDSEMLPYCTPKVLFAMANKKWIVSEQWIETCLELNMILDEQPFESCDPVGGDGCKAARLSKEPLLKDLEVCLLGEFQMLSKEEFAGLVIDCGGSLVSQPDKFSFQPGKIRMIVADRDCLELDENHIQGLFKKFKTVVLSRDVIILSIQSFKLVNFTPHLLTLTSEEELIKLGYPYELVKHEEESEWSAIK